MKSYGLHYQVAKIRIYDFEFVAKNHFLCLFRLYTLKDSCFKSGLISSAPETCIDSSQGESPVLHAGYLDSSVYCNPIEYNASPDVVQLNNNELCEDRNGRYLSCETSGGRYNNSDSENKGGRNFLTVHTSKYEPQYHFESPHKGRKLKYLKKNVTRVIDPFPA